MATQRCPLCRKEYNDIFALGNHLEKKHYDEFPDKEWSGVKYLFYLKHGRTTGSCIVCHKPTEFNESTGKPNRLCNDPNCRKKLRESAVNNMRKKYGKDTLLNDPEFQIKMLQNRRISKEYKWSDNSAIKKCVGNYEYDCLRLLDVLLNLESEDVLVPAPFIFDYNYQGKTHFYIPDIYISSLNILIECKDGHDNPNNHPKIQAIDKEKEKLKDQAVKKNGKYNFVKVMNKDYGKLIQTIIDLKKREVDNIENTKPIIITEDAINNILNESIKSNDYIVEIVIFHDKDISFMNEIGLRCNNKIYYFSNELIVRNDVEDVIIENRYDIYISNKLKKVVCEDIESYMNIDDSEMTPQNFPALILYYILYNYNDIDIAKIDVMDLYTIDDYFKLPWISSKDKDGLIKINENAFKNLLEPDELEKIYILDSLLPEEIKENNNYPIKGLPIKVNDNKDFDKLKFLYDKNFIPKQYTMSVYDYIYNNINKLSIEESQVRSIMNTFDFNSIYVSSDYHFYREGFNDDDVNDIINKHDSVVGNDDMFILLGDLASKDFDNVYNSLKNIISSLNGRVKVLIKGNHDTLSDKEYIDMGFDYVVNKLEYQDMLFTHFPIPKTEFSDNIKLNIHGHLHDENEYMNMNPKDHINVYINTYDKPLNLNQIRKQWKNGNIERNKKIK